MGGIQRGNLGQGGGKAVHLPVSGGKFLHGVLQRHLGLGVTATAGRGKIFRRKIFGQGRISANISADQPGSGGAIRRRADP